MSVKVDNDKKKRYVLREVLFNGKNGSIINKAITMKQDNKYGFVTIKRIQIKPEESNLIEKYDKESKEAQLIEHDNLIQYYDNFLCEVVCVLIQIHYLFEGWKVGILANIGILFSKSVDIYLSHHRNLTDDERYFFLCDLSIGMEHLIRSSHQQHFLLNPHNLILTKDTSSPIPKLKISNYKGNVLFDTPKDIFLANQFYTAPELYLNKTFDNSDIWSVGMLIYVLFTSKFPFVPSKLYESLSKQVKIDLSSILDKSLVDLLSRMLIYDPIKRMSWDDFFIHPFIQRCRDHKIESICGNAEPYTPKKIIGKGGFCVVFTAERMLDEMKQCVALKEIGESKKHFLLKEARIMKLCVHPNVVAFHDYFESDQKLSDLCLESDVLPPRHSYKEQKQQIESHYYYLAMEYCDLGTLESYLERNNGPLTTPEILHFLAEIASGLWYLHFCKHILHRDLKLENFLLCTPQHKSMKYPRLKIADYGLSRAFGDDSQLLQSNVGTFMYVSPEIKNNKVYTTKSDLYSLGVVLYRLATNEFPFSANKATVEYAFQTKQPISFPSYVNVEFHLQDLICKLITHDEQSRLSWRDFFAHQFVYRAMQHHAAQSHTVPTKHDFDLLEQQQIYEVE